MILRRKQSGIIKRGDFDWFPDSIANPPQAREKAFAVAVQEVVEYGGWMNAPRIEVGETTIGDLVDLQANRIGDNIAIEYPMLGIRYRFREFRDICNDVAKGLMSLGIEAGENIAIWANNIPEWVYTQFGSAKMGAVLVTVNTNYRSSELQYLMQQSDSTTLLMVGGVREADEYIRIINELCPGLKKSRPGKLKCDRFPKLRHVIYFGKEKIPGMHNWDDIIEAGQKVTDEALKVRTASLKAQDVINMQYTSGTTGFPKGVMLTHTNLIGNALSMAERMKLSPVDRICIPVPFFHCFGCVIGTLCCMVSGATMAPVLSFNAKAVLETVQASKCTAVHGVPTMFIAELEEMEKADYDTSHLRTGVMAGSPCPVEVMKAVVEKMGAREMTIVYGLTEASPGVTQTRPDDPVDLRVSTVGRALPNVEVKIVDLMTREEVPAGLQGELWTRGYHVMKGYYKMPEATDEAIDSDHWLHTGDLAIMDENGYCKITGRIKDMIIRGGENIYPREIEEFLYTHAKIKDVQIVGVPSRKYGEEVVAFVQVKPGLTCTEEEIKEFCRDKIAFHKIPAYVLFTDRFPTTASGKIQKYKLREQAIQKLGRQENKWRSV